MSTTFSEIECEEALSELRPRVNLLVRSMSGWKLFVKFSKYLTVVRVCGWLLRFKYRSVHHGDLSIEEKWRVELTVARIVQQYAFHVEIVSLKKDGTVASSSSIAPLHPFSDDEKIVRVGARLIHSNLPQITTHPILLPAKHEWSAMIVQNFHELYFHAGVQLTISMVRQRYWLVPNRNSYV